MAHGDFTMLLPDDPVVYAFTRRLGDVELLVLANFSGRAGRPPTSPAMPSGPAGELVLGNVADAQSPELAAWEARVHRRTVAPSP